MRQVLSEIGSVLTNKEVLAIDYRYKDDLGFDYIGFLKEVAPQDPCIPRVISQIISCQNVS